MDTKWTPGPWRVGKRGSKWLTTTISGGLGFTRNIARVDIVYGMADAHLIAAAPDLYEALSEIMDEINLGGWESPVYDDARAVLVKARGET